MRFILVAEQAAQKTGRGLRLLRQCGMLRHLLLQILNLRLRLLQRIVLHQHRLRQDVGCIRVALRPLFDPLRRFRIFLVQTRAVHARHQVVQHLLFLRGHRLSISCRAIHRTALLLRCENALAVSEVPVGAAF